MASGAADRELFLVVSRQSMQRHMRFAPGLFVTFDAMG
jgi:hypothetical protein